jgi:hypothetical protein
VYQVELLPVQFKKLPVKFPITQVDFSYTIISGKCVKVPQILCRKDLPVLPDFSEELIKIFICIRFLQGHEREVVNMECRIACQVTVADLCENRINESNVVLRFLDVLIIKCL